MDLSGLLFGAGSKLPENQNHTNDALAGQTQQDNPDGVKTGFWQFLQHFLRSHTAAEAGQNLDITNIGFSEIDINPSAIVVEGMIAEGPQTLLQSDSGQPATGVAEIENKARFREAFSKMSEKQWLTFNELADRVSLAKNATPGNLFSDENLQQVAGKLQTILFVAATETASVPVENTAQVDLQPVIKVQTQLSLTGDETENHLVPEKLPTENIPSPDLETRGNPAIQKLDFRAESEKSEIVENEKASLQKPVLRPIALASKNRSDIGQPPKISPAFSFQTGVETYIVELEPDQNNLDIELIGVAVNSERARNLLQIMAPENDEAAQDVFMSSSEPENRLSAATVLPAAEKSTAKTLKQETADQEMPSSAKPLLQPDDSSATADEVNEQNLDSERAGTLSLQVPVAAGQKSKTPQATPLKHPQPPQPVVLNGKIPAEDTAYLKLDINETVIDESLENLESTGKLERRISEKLNVRILKISRDAPEQVAGQVYNKVQEIVLPEKSKAQLLESVHGFQKTASAWQLALSDKLQQQNQAPELRSAVATGGNDNPGTRQNAMKSYSENAHDRSQTKKEPTTSPELTEVSGKMVDEGVPVLKEKPVFPPLHEAKITATKSKLMQQIDRVKSFENIRSQIAARVRQGQSEIQIQLKPESLGSMKLLMSMKNGWLNVNFLVESSEVKALLEKNIPALRETLADRGIKAEHVEVQINQQVVQTQRAENQDARNSRNNPDEQRQKQEEQPRKQRQNQDKAPRKQFDQYL